MIVEIISKFLVFSIFLVAIFNLAILIYFIFSKLSGRKLKIISEISEFGKEHYLWIGLVFSLGAVVGSLFYSEVLGYIPCTMCWYQRAFMFPQVFIFALALFLKDKKISSYSILLSVVGGLIALYQYFLQIGIVEDSIICSALDPTSSCASSYFLEFGFISIPTMSLITFVFLIILGLNARK